MNHPAPWGTTAPPPPPGPAAAAAVDERPPDVDEPAPLHHAPFGLPASAVGAPSTSTAPIPPGVGSPEIARAWLQHLGLVVADARAVLAALPHGAVVDARNAAPPIIEQILRTL